MVVNFSILIEIFHSDLKKQFIGSLILFSDPVYFLS